NQFIVRNLVCEDALALESAEDEAFDEIALGKEKEHDDWHRHGGGGSHKQVPFGAHDAAEGGQTNSDGEIVVRTQVQQRANVVIPGKQKGKDRHGGEGRFAERRHNLPVDAKFVAAVDAPGVGQLFRERAEELAEE